jgi:hypothetical protein
LKNASNAREVERRGDREGSRGRSRAGGRRGVHTVAHEVVRRGHKRIGRKAVVRGGEVLEGGQKAVVEVVGAADLEDVG